jgi:hypothetical protein
VTTTYPASTPSCENYPTHARIRLSITQTASTDTFQYSHHIAHSIVLSSLTNGDHAVTETSIAHSGSQEGQPSSSVRLFALQQICAVKHANILAQIIGHRLKQRFLARPYKPSTQAASHRSSPLRYSSHVHLLVPPTRQCTLSAHCL